MAQQSGAGSPQQFCLRWNNYQTNLTNVFDQLLQSESFVDVTLACDGHSVKAHKMVLSACSPYFQALFFDNPCQHPIVIMKDIKWPELKAAVEFMYKGEINVSQEQIGPLLKVAESLKIRGLADVNNEQELITRPTLEDAALNMLHRKKRRRGSGERSPSANSPDQNSSEDHDPGSIISAEVHGLGSSSTPRSLGSPNAPSISVTPQINLQELPVSLSLPPPPPPSVSSQSSHPGVGHHVLGHVTSGPHVSVNHLGSHAAQQLSIQQAQQAQQQAQQAQQQQQQQQRDINQTIGPPEDLEIKPGIAEMIREEERAKLLESSHAWLGASTSSIAADYSNLLKLKAPTWTRHDLQEAIEAVVTQKMRFTQASTKYGIPKGTLYDNILGKSKRMMVLEEAGLNASDESAVLEFCCDTSIHPYNRRTKKSLNTILNFVEKIRRERDPNFMFTGLSGFRWWWAFCKKHSIVSLYFNDENEHE
ncbi:protein bric-a-brac 1-like isoform X3 [Leptopilina heterotoma]|uniref:protein bric-a-brac 1-like isoform X3 n=1 Tax=Leptopilina heterotoma TaxID=63436 RepID=UPI001CA96C5A|nr:protein bric-a-brac 1-like isoform X3 [Leptopilina heterotoma]